MAIRRSPRLFLAASAALPPCPGGPGGLAARRPGRWVSGRESGHLPPVEAGAETPVVVQDAKVLVAGCKGVRPPPCSMGPGRAEVSLCRDATAMTLRQPGRARCPSA